MLNEQLRRELVQMGRKHLGVMENLGAELSNNQPVNFRNK
jgi:hypothetical protein